MIPFFKHKGTWDALEEVRQTKIVDVSKYPKGVVKELKEYDDSIFFLRGHHPFVFVESTKNKNKSDQVQTQNKTRQKKKCP